MIKIFMNSLNYILEEKNRNYGKRKGNSERPLLD